MEQVGSRPEDRQLALEVRKVSSRPEYRQLAVEGRGAGRVGCREVCREQEYSSPRTKLEEGVPGVTKSTNCFNN